MKKPKIETLKETVKISIDAIENLLDEIFLLREENEKIKKKLKSVRAKLKRLVSENGRK